MISKLFETLGMAVVGAFLGALFGIFVFMAIFAANKYLLYAFLVFVGFTGLFFLTKLLKKHSTSILGIFVSALQFTFIIAGIGGLIYFFSEEGNYEDSDMYLIIGSVLVFIPLFAFLIPLRYVWHETAMSKRVGSTINGLKALKRRSID